MKIGICINKDLAYKDLFNLLIKSGYVYSVKQKQTRIAPLLRGQR